MVEIVWNFYDVCSLSIQIICANFNWSEQFLKELWPKTIK